VDGGQVATPAANPAVSPDGSRVLFVWNGYPRKAGHLTSSIP
jgi:hypothetical protein